MKTKLQKGQSVVILMIFATITVVVSTAAVMTMAGTVATSSRSELGQYAYFLAESGIENALLRLLRDPSYAGEVLTTSVGQNQITVTGTNQLTVVSTGIIGNFSRRIETTVTFSSGVMTVLSWQEQ